MRRAASRRSRARASEGALPAAVGCAPAPTLKMVVRTGGSGEVDRATGGQSGPADPVGTRGQGAGRRGRTADGGATRRLGGVAGEAFRLVSVVTIVLLSPHRPVFV